MPCAQLAGEAHAKRLPICLLDLVLLAGGRGIRRPVPVLHSGGEVWAPAMVDRAIDQVVRLQYSAYLPT